ncbi:hypothetical protein Ahy_B10g102296 [Arachis hypogaea]|uniref:Uncharacterized protein n=1 Tax=Arachis hypogaea TaxID=3818 RepID=A0A444X1T7_ARAHY|nr:hypothetical protein Ahy_B10g102296 [Arachis hypogaea]
MQEADRRKTPETTNLLEQLEDLVQKIASSAVKEESKSPQIQKETGGESSGKFETPAGINQNTVLHLGDVSETYADDSTNEFDNLCTLIVSAMCLILNQKNDKRFQKQVYCLPPDIVSMAVSKQPNGEFISPKTNKEFKVEDYPMFIPFIDGKKLALHRYGYVISRIRTYADGAPLKKKENELEIKATYVKISGQKSRYKFEEVDHYRVEYASRILFSEMNKERDQAIRASNAIRLSKPSSILLSPFCQINSTDIETE